MEIDDTVLDIDYNRFVEIGIMKLLMSWIYLGNYTNLMVAEIFRHVVDR